MALGKEITMREQDYRITSSDEYKSYMKALCRLACEYVSEIRVQFADKAYDMSQDETVRKIVLEYGKEAEELDKDRLMDFRHISEFGPNEYGMRDTCLNNARHYAKTIYMLFDIQHIGKEA